MLTDPPLLNLEHCLLLGLKETMNLSLKETILNLMQIEKNKRASHSELHLDKGSLVNLVLESFLGLSM